MPYNSNDNTRVNRPLIQEPIKYKLQPGEVRLPSGQIIKVKQAELSQGSSEPKVLRDKRHKELTKQHEQQKQKEREAFTIQGLTAPLQLISPSHIIGSANSDKPFLESYLGDSYNSATGSMLGDFALDAVVGGGLWKGAKVAGDLAKVGNLSNKMRWYGRAALDGIFNPMGTYDAVKQGRYVYDQASLRRNLERIYAKMDEGIQSTIDEYKNLTGLKMPKPTVKIKPSKWFKLSVNGTYKNNKIHVLLTDHFSNISPTDRHFRQLGGHEQTHFANDVLTYNFNTPPLKIYKEKILKFIPNNYYIPNKAHPIGKKYYKPFMRSLLSHGRSPEESWANYMGAKAIGLTDKQYPQFNFSIELMRPPKGFIEDYKTYLSDTYQFK